MRYQRSTIRGQEQDDILALDYLPPGHRRSWSLPIWSAEWRQAVNKQLAHVAYCRDKEWNHVRWASQLENEFRAAWRDFRQAITDQEYRHRFAELITYCQRKPGFGAVTLE